jgi:hypothetical protein
MCHDMSQNDTVTECPVIFHKDQNEFIAIVHNQQVKVYSQLIRILLPS